MFFEKLRSILQTQPDSPLPTGNPASELSEVDPLQLAACALLFDVAYADGEFSESEREQIAHAVERHFQLTPEAGNRLLELAEREHGGSIDQFRFTARLREEYDHHQKMVLAEIMWSVVLSDGEISEHESYITRKISNLLDIAPGYLSTAKASAERAAAESESPD